MQLATRILVPSSEDVDTYLRAYPDIAALLPDMCDAASAQLGPQTQLSLEVYRDREADDHYLALYARQDPYDPGIIDAIDQVARAFDQRLTNSSGWLLLTTDFRPPR